MKICLVNPDLTYAVETIREHTLHMPMGLLILAAIMEQEGHEVTLVDMGWLWRNGELCLEQGFLRDACSYILAKNADIVGFSTRCDSFATVLCLARRLKNKRPELPILLGGPQVSFTDLETLKLIPQVDYIIRGEAELSIAPFLSALESGKSLDSIPGLTFKKNGKPARNPDAPIVKNLDTIPFPAYHLMDPYITPGGDYSKYNIYLPVGRGCPGQCTFCVACKFNPGLRYNSINRIIEEIKFLKDRYNLNGFTLGHDNLLVNRKMIEKLREKLAGESGLRLSCIGRIDVLDNDYLEMLAKTGFHALLFGIESGSARIQKIIKKNLDLEKVKPVLSFCQEHGILAIISLIIGFPEETTEDIDATMLLALECRSYPVVLPELHLLSPMAGAPVLEKYKNSLKYTGIFSDAVDSPTLHLKEIRALIRKYPELFSTHRMLPTSVPRGLVIEISYTFRSILYTFPFITRLAIKELEITPTTLMLELRHWARKEKGFKGRYLLLSHTDLKNHYPEFVCSLYRKNNKSTAMLNKMLEVEMSRLNIIMEEDRKFYRGASRALQKVMDKTVFGRILPYNDEEKNHHKKTDIEGA
ncbi:MAG: B12-binding domain-containing radical SAM protein [Candidatus Eremiobacteraeota bacterium]|nr:B12-binding domain-containing radical SAM protein [Candidatus Eremiobacteraeota bacterium]